MVQILADIIEFSELNVKILQDDGLREPVPDSWLEPLVLSLWHDVAGV